MLHDREHLDLAIRHVAEAKVRVKDQQRLVARLRRGGYPTELAEEFLASLLQTMDQMRRHRNYLIRQLGSD